MDPAGMGTVSPIGWMIFEAPSQRVSLMLSLVRRRVAVTVEFDRFRRRPNTPWPLPVSLPRLTRESLRDSLMFEVEAPLVILKDAVGDTDAGAGAKAGAGAGAGAKAASVRRIVEPKIAPRAPRQCGLPP